MYHLQAFDVALLATWAVELVIHIESRQVFCNKSFDLICHSNIFVGHFLVNLTIDLGVPIDSC